MLSWISCQAPSLTSSLQWKLSANICEVFVKSFNFRLISAKIPQLQKSEIDDRENENESRLFCQVRLPGGKSFDMVGWTEVNLWCYLYCFIHLLFLITFACGDILKVELPSWILILICFLSEMDNIELTEAERTFQYSKSIQNSFCLMRYVSKLFYYLSKHPYSCPFLVFVIIFYQTRSGPKSICLIW